MVLNGFGRGIPHAPGLAIVLGGTVAATFICYPLREVMRVMGLFVTAFTAEELPIGDYIKDIVKIPRTPPRARNIWNARSRAWKTNF